MTTHPKVRGPYSRSGHRIDIIDYSEDYLLCICGWEGFAYDRIPRTEKFIEEKDYPLHKKTAEKITGPFEDKYRGNYGTMTIVKPGKEKAKKYGHSPVTHGAARSRKKKVMV